MARDTLRAIFLLTFVAAVPRAACAQAQAARADKDTTTSVSAQLTDHETGEPIQEALVRLVSGAGPHASFRTRVTNPDGRFFFSNIPAGSYRLEIARVGYVPSSDSIRLPPGSHVQMLLQLSSSPVLLPPVIVVVHPRSGTQGAVPGLKQREQRGLGTILTQKKIEDYHAFEISGLLREVPGVRLVPNQDLGYDIRLRGGCKPAVWVDGTPTSTTDIDILLRPSDLQAVEVYQAGQVPVQFADGGSSCGAVLFWTRPAQGGMKFNSWWKKLIIPVAILVGAIIKMH